MQSDCVNDSTVKCIIRFMHLPNVSSVVSDIILPPPGDAFPPNTTTILKVGPQPNAEAERQSRGVMGCGRVTYKNV